MLTYISILDAITKKLSEFNIDIFVDKFEQGFDKSCFFISLIPINASIFTSTQNLKNLMIAIQYFSDNDSKYDFLNMIDSLENTFIRNIRVKDRFITIKNSEAEIVEDEKGNYINFLITLSYADGIKIEKEHFEPVGSIKINTDWEE